MLNSFTTYDTKRRRRKPNSFLLKFSVIHVSSFESHPYLLVLICSLTAMFLRFINYWKVSEDIIFISLYSLYSFFFWIALVKSTSRSIVYPQERLLWSRVHGMMNDTLLKLKYSFFLLLRIRLLSLFETTHLRCRWWSILIPWWLSNTNIEESWARDASHSW